MPEFGEGSSQSTQGTPMGTPERPIEERQVMSAVKQVRAQQERARQLQGALQTGWVGKTPEPTAQIADQVRWESGVVRGSQSEQKDISAHTFQTAENLYNPRNGDEHNEMDPMIQQLYGELMARGSRMAEILRKEPENPMVVRRALRELMAGEERATYRGLRRPNEYLYDGITRAADDRLSEFRMMFDGKLPAIKRVEGRGRNTLVQPYAKDEIKAMHREYMHVVDELFARTMFLETFLFMETYAGDVDEFMKRMGARGLKVPHAKFFRIIGNLSESEEGLPPFGSRVDQALRLWCDLAENRRAGVKDERTGQIVDRVNHEVLVETDATGRITRDDRIYNPFRDYIYDDEYQKCVEFIATELTGIQVKGKLDADAILELGPDYRDAMDAAYLAYGLFKLFNFDMTYSVISEGGKTKISVSHVDSAKARYLALRQVREIYQDHPWAAGLPAVAGVFPALSRDFLECISISGKAKNDKGEEFTRRISFKELWRDQGVPLGELPFDMVYWPKGVEFLRPKYTVDDKGNPIVEWGPDVEGVQEKAMFVPWFLADQYGSTILGLVFSNPGARELKDLEDKAKTAGELEKINKAFGVAIDIQYSASGLERSNDREKLRQFVKITWLAGVVIALTEQEMSFANRGTFGDRLKRALTPTSETRNTRELKTLFLAAASSSGFFSPEGKGFQEEKALFEKIIKERRGFMPHELIDTFFKGKNYEEAKAQVGRIYNSGGYDYNPLLEDPAPGKPIGDLRRDRKEAEAILKERFERDKKLIEELREPRFAELMQRLVA